MTTAAKRTVQVRIQGRAYKIRAEVDTDAASVNRAAALLDETIERVRLRAGTVDSIDIAMLAALNVANSLVSERESRRGASVPDGSITALIALVESALGADGAGAS
jgi:cell division protein ZapA (FtsZ GTPase activity inhibitor)